MSRWLTLAILAAGAVTPSARDIRGTYRLHGTARLAVGSVDRGMELHADAIVGPGERPGEIRVHVAAEGYGCDLAARLGAGGALTFEGGQRCDVVITSPDARGHLVARLRSGRGRVEGTRLSLDLSGDVEGGLSYRTEGVRILGADIPATWTPEVPVRGAVAASARGDIDRSRAGGARSSGASAPPNR